MIYARRRNYQAPKYSWQQSDMPEPAVLLMVKTVQIIILSFSFQG